MISSHTPNLNEMLSTSISLNRNSVKLTNKDIGTMSVHVMPGFLASRLKLCFIDLLDCFDITEEIFSSRPMQSNYKV